MSAVDPKNDLVQFNELLAELAVAVEPMKAMVVSDKVSSDTATQALREIKFYKDKIEARRKEAVTPLNDRVARINDYRHTVLAPILAAEEHLKKQQLDFERILEAERAEQGRLERIEQEKRDAAARAEIERQRKEAAEQIAKQRAEAEEAARIAKEEAEFMAQFTEDHSEAEAIKANAETEAAELKAKTEREVAEITARAHVESQKIEFESKKEHWDVSKDIRSNKVAGATKRWVHKISDPSLVPREFLMVDEKKGRDYYMDQVKKKIKPEIPGFEIYQETSISTRR